MSKAGVIVALGAAAGIVILAFAVADHIGRATTVRIHTPHGSLISDNRRLLR